MKAHELMIGDWVQVPVELNRYKKIMSTYDMDSAPLYKPIPLTPEILEKNGFREEERECDPTFPYLAYILDGNDYSVEITWYDAHDRYEPNTGQFIGGVPTTWTLEVSGKMGYLCLNRSKMYIHELQRAFKLCGIEKEIIV